MNIDTIQIETTNNCNNNCIFCPHNKITNRTHMNMDLFKKIIDQAVKVNPKKIVPFLNGEPFLDPLFFKRLAYIREKLPEVYIEIHTNGHLLSDKVVEELNEYKVDFVNVSINAFTEETYQKVCGSTGLEEVKNNTITLLTEFNGICRVSFVPLDINKHEMNDFNIFWSSVYNQFNRGSDGSSIQFNKLYNWGGQVYNSETRIEPCFRMMSHITILANGSVALCCMDFNTTIGDLNNQTIEEVWEANKWRRTMHLKLKRPMMKTCQNCNMQ